MSAAWESAEVIEAAAETLGAAFEGMFFPGWDHVNEFDRKLYRRYAARVLAKFGPDLYEQGRLAGVAEEVAAAKAREEIANRPRQEISYPYGIAPGSSMAAVDRAIIPTGGAK